jgi:hypothetical protein
MFTWICPQCGREVPPSYTDCPDCAAKGKTPPAPPPAQPPAPSAPPPQPTYQAAPPAYQPAPPQPQYQPAPPAYQPAPQQQQYYYPPPRAGLPTWLMSIVFTLAFGGIVLGAYYAVEYFKKDSSAAAHSGAVEVEKPVAASSTADAKGSPLRKQIEVVGLRLTQNNAKKTEVRFLVVNHSGAEIQDLAVNANLQARTSKRDEEPVGTFSFKVSSLGPYESKEMSSVVNTKLKVYELPDWQNRALRLQFTSP